MKPLLSLTLGLIEGRKWDDLHSGEHQRINSQCQQLADILKLQVIFTDSETDIHYEPTGSDNKQ